MLCFHFNVILVWVQGMQKAQDSQDMEKTKNEAEFLAILLLHFRSNLLSFPLILWSNMQSNYY